MDDVSTSTLIIILIVLIFMSAYFSASETGMMTLNRYRLKHLAKQGNRSAIRVEKLLKHPEPPSLVFAYMVTRVSRWQLGS